MGKFIDLTGQRFNRLIVLEREGYAPNGTGKKAIQWKCLCDCGNICHVMSHSLKSGNTKSCGCLHSEVVSKMNFMDLTGKKFGILTVLKLIGSDKHRNNKWSCECKCRRITEVRGCDLTGGYITSCGCLGHLKHIKNLKGQKFGKLTVIEKVEKEKDGNARWLCQCECGKQTTVIGISLRRGNTKSCGCWQRKVTGKLSLKHSGSKTRLYKIWSHMISRCNNSKSNAYKDYGGRGISICNEWREFIPFINWAHNNGYRDDLTIERKDVNGNYEPGNCTWIPNSEQSKNRRSQVTINGKTQTTKDWAKEYGICEGTIGYRVNNFGWSKEQAITTPLMR
jgi:hypothetical protein